MSIDESLNLRMYAGYFPWILKRIELMLCEGGLEMTQYHQTVHGILAMTGIVNQGLEVHTVRSYVAATASTLIDAVGAVEVRTINRTFVCLPNVCPSEEVQESQKEYYGFYRIALEHVKQYNCQVPMPSTLLRRKVDECLRKTDLPDVAKPQNLTDVIRRISEEIMEEPFIYVSRNCTDKEEKAAVAYAWSREYLKKKGIDTDNF